MSVCPSVRPSVFLFVINMSKQLHISSLPLSSLAFSSSPLLVYVRLSAICSSLSCSLQLLITINQALSSSLQLLALASYIISLCQAIRLSSISLFSPLALASYLVSLCQAISHISISFWSLSLLSTKGIATVSHFRLVRFGEVLMNLGRKYELHGMME